MTEITRYDMTSYGHREESSSGEYVTHDDHVAAITALNAERHNLRTQRDVAREKAIEDVLVALTWHELYLHQPNEFKGFIEYARTTISVASTTPETSPSCEKQHKNYIGKCPYCGTKLPSIVPSPALEAKTACPCTMFEQDEDCPVGFPSLLCSVCHGTGHASQEQVVALAAEMLKVAEQVDELEDPFAAWETIDLIKTQNERLTALEANQQVIETLRAALSEMIDAMVRYEIDVDADAAVPSQHYRMMERARAALTLPTQDEA